jgi:hypothetical protein
MPQNYCFFCICASFAGVFAIFVEIWEQRGREENKNAGGDEINDNSDNLQSTPKS